MAPALGSLPSDSLVSGTLEPGSDRKSQTRTAGDARCAKTADHSAALQGRNNKGESRGVNTATETAAVKKGRRAQGFLPIIPVWYINRVQFPKQPNLPPNPWTSLCGFKAAPLFRDAPCPSLPAVLPQNQNQPETNLTQPELSSRVPSQGIPIFNELLTVATPNSTRTYDVSTLCPAL